MKCRSISLFFQFKFSSAHHVNLKQQIVALHDPYTEVCLLEESIVHIDQFDLVFY